MRILITTDEGEVLDSFDTKDEAAEWPRDFPNGDLDITDKAARKMMGCAFSDLVNGIARRRGATIDWDE